MNKRTVIISLLTSFALVAAMFTNLVSGSARAQRKPAQQTAKVMHPSLSRYAVDLTQLTRLGRLETRTGHQAELDRMIKLLSTDGQRNPVLITDSPANVQEIAESLARKIARGKVPDSLQSKQVFRLNIEALSAGVKDSAEFVTRLQAVLNETAEAKGQIILFVGQLHQFVGSYASIQATTAIREALEHSQFKMIGAATAPAYATYIAGDDSLTKLFQTIRISEETAQLSASSNRTNSEDAADDNGFVGDNVSPDMREMIQSAGSPDERVTAILQVDDVRNSELSDVLKRSGVTVTDRMAQLGTVMVQVPVKAIAELAANHLTNYISPDTKLESFGYGHVVVTTGTDLVRTQTGGLLGLGGSTLDGSGIGIAVLDSGVDNSHAAFASNRIKFNKDFTGENNPTNDTFGHGTHVTSSAAGLSTRNGDRYQGIAPGANIINLRVLNSQGTGTSSALLNALNWILSPADPTKVVSPSNPLNKDKYNIRVVNMSLGAQAVSSYRNDPICRAARALVDAGIVVVAAAGNNGKDVNGNKIYGQIHSPGNEPSVITVGAANTFGTDDRNDDGVATYSSRGPTRSHYTDASDVTHYDNIVKPELVAPGNKLIFAESDSGGRNGLLGFGGTAAEHNLLVTLHPELDSGLTDDNNRRLMYLSGTSMATPVVAGAAALLLQAKPQLTPNMVKALLMYTAQPLRGFNMLEQGVGSLNVEGAVRVAKLVRTDLSSSTPTGSPLLTTSTPPNQQTTIAGQTFTWSRGLVVNHSYLTGTNLIMKYQPIYALGVVVGDGDVAGDGIMVNDGVVVGDDIVMGEGIMVSDGVVVGDGTMFLAVSQLMGDGIMLGDGVVVGDGVINGDGIMVNDGVVVGDALVQAMANRAMIRGDNSPCMH